MIVTHYISEPLPKEGAILVSIITINDGKYYFGKDYNNPISVLHIKKSIENGHLIELNPQIELKNGFGLWLTYENKIIINRIQ